MLRIKWSLLRWVEAFFVEDCGQLLTLNISNVLSGLSWLKNVTDAEQPLIGLQDKNNICK